MGAVAKETAAGENNLCFQPASRNSCKANKPRRRCRSFWNHDRTEINFADCVLSHIFRLPLSHFLRKPMPNQVHSGYIDISTVPLYVKTLLSNCIKFVPQER